MDSLFSKRHSFSRSDRVAGLLRTEVNEILQRKVKDPRLSALTITGVEVQPDLKNAHIKICKFMTGEFREPEEAEIKNFMRGLKSATPFVQQQLKKSLRMKSIPHLEFEYDWNIAKTSEVLSLINRLSQDAKKRGDS